MVPSAFTRKAEGAASKSCRHDTERASAGGSLAVIAEVVNSWLQPTVPTQHQLGARRRRYPVIGGPAHSPKSTPATYPIQTLLGPLFLVTW